MPAGEACRDHRAHVVLAHVAERHRRRAVAVCHVVSASALVPNGKSAVGVPCLAQPLRRGSRREYDRLGAYAFQVAPIPRFAFEIRHSENLPRSLTRALTWAGPCHRHAPGFPLRSLTPAPPAVLGDEHNAGAFKSGDKLFPRVREAAYRSTVLRRSKTHDHRL